MLVAGCTNGRNFSDTKSGAGWRLVSRVAAGAETAPDVVRSTPAEVEFAFSVHESTGGQQKCTSPTVVIRDTKRTDDSATVLVQWRQRGCAGKWQRYTIAFARPSSTASLGIGWHAEVEGPCHHVLIEGPTVHAELDTPNCEAELGPSAS
jgi:hypothetical protein